jgi:hypothetical protein
MNPQNLIILLCYTIKDEYFPSLRNHFNEKMLSSTNTFGNLKSSYC